jgi:O-acetylhomoserine (thiol)-lyase
VATLLGAGDHIVASRSIYGGTHNLLDYTLRRFGIDTTFVDPRSPQDFANAIQDNTRLVFGEILGNPGLEVLNVPEISKVAHDAGLPLMVDATFTTPYLCRPIDLGADIVMHSATKFLSGHGIVIGGLLVDGGTFDWAASGKFPTMSEPYAGFHNLNFSEEFGPAAFITRARKEGLRDFGACMSPTTAFHILQGMETLPLRMQKHVTNTAEIVEFLARQEGVERVNHPMLESHPDHELAKSLLPKGCGAVFGFELTGGRQAGIRFIEALEVFSHLANVGDAKSLVIHPASTTHHRMGSDALEKAGISEGLIRLSVGLEDTKDLIADLKKGLRAAGRA